MREPVLPYRVNRYNEGSACFLETTHLNKSKVATAPTTMKYRIDDRTNNREVLDWTTVSTPGITNTITITDTQNALFSRHNKKELRQVTVKTTDASGNDGLEDFFYEVIRIFTRADQLDT